MAVERDPALCNYALHNAKQHGYKQWCVLDRGHNGNHEWGEEVINK